MIPPEKKKTRRDESGIGKDQATFDCPHCRIRSLHILSQQTKASPITYSVVIPARFERGGGDAIEQLYRHYIYNCVNCQKDTYFLVKEAGGYVIGEGRRMQPISSPRIVVHQWPVPTPSMHEAIPDSVRKAAVEAEKCLGVRAANACATMTRKAMEAMARDKGAKGADLYGRLKDLKERNLITPDLWDWAEDLRILGRSGAHDEWEDVSAEDAEYGVQFMREILRYVYINPSERAARRLKETLKRKPEPEGTPTEPATGAT